MFYMEIQTQKHLKKFQYSITPLSKQLTKTLKIMAITKRFELADTMTENQKERFEYDCERLNKSLEKSIEGLKKLKEKLL